MPAQRRQLIEHLIDVETTTTTAAAALLGLPTSTARRTLEDLAAHNVVNRHIGGQGKPDSWTLNAQKRLDYAAATVPDTSETHSSIHTNIAFDDKSGKVGSDA